MPPANYLQKMRRNITVYLLAQAFTGLLFTIPVWVAFERQFLTYQQMAWLEVLAFGVTTLLEIPTGALADLIGRKATIVAGWLIYGITYIFFGFIDSISQLIIGMCVMSIGAALVSGADTALVYDSLKELKREDEFSGLIAKSRLIYRGVMVLAVFSGGYLYQIYTGLPYIFRGVFQLFGVISYLFLTEPKIDTEKFSFANYKKQTKEGFKQLFKTPYVKTLSLYYVLVASFTWSCVYYFINAYAKDSGYTEIEQSWAFSVIYIVTTFVILYYTKNKSKFPKDLVFTLFPILMIVSFLPGFWAGKTVVFFLMLGIVQANGARFAILDAYVNEKFDSKHRATALSTLNMGVSMFYMLIVLVGGYIQEVYTTKAVWSLLGMLSLVLLIPVTLKLKAYNQALEDNLI